MLFLAAYLLLAGILSVGAACALPDPAAAVFQALLATALFLIAVRALLLCRLPSKRRSFHA